MNTESCSSFPLFEAVSSGNLELVKLLLGNEKISANRYERSSGYTCLHAAIFHSQYSGDNKALKYLLQDKRIDLNARCRAPLVLGYTPFHLAAFIGNLAAIEELAKAGASLLDKTENGQSVFEIAGESASCTLSNQEIIEAIRKADLKHSHASV